MRSSLVSRACAFCAAATFLAAGAVASAQEEGQPERRPEARPAERAPADPAEAERGRASPQASQKNDAALATCLLIDNQVEAALGEFAQKRAESEEVRKFAERMVQEHSQAAETFKRIALAGKADSAAATSPEATRADAPRADAPREEVAPRATREAAARTDRADAYAVNPQAMFFITLKKEMGEQCLQSAQKELGAKKGEDFDRCYMTSQVMAHQHMHDALTVMERHAGQELRQAIAQAKETTEQHLEEAKSIAKKFEGKSEQTTTAKKAASAE